MQSYDPTHHSARSFALASVKRLNAVTYSTQHTYAEQERLPRCAFVCRKDPPQRLETRERPQTHVLDRADTGFGDTSIRSVLNLQGFDYMTLRKANVRSEIVQGCSDARCDPSARQCNPTQRIAQPRVVVVSLGTIVCAAKAIHLGGRSSIVRKWKWRLVNGCEYKSPIYAAIEFLNPCHDGTSASMCSGISLKNSGYTVE
jgi:hypothetical protein